MKPPPEEKRAVVAEWVRKAEQDIAAAEYLLPFVAESANAIAFHSQQAAEKYLKALLTWWSIDFPKTHVITRLLALVETRDRALAKSLVEAIVVSHYGVGARYPGESPDASPAEAEEAVRLAKMVRDAVRPLLPL